MVGIAVSRAIASRKIIRQIISPLVRTMSRTTIAFSEIEKHRSKDDCWVVLHGKVYDLTSFLPEHPGGVQIILKEAGRDATAAFSTFHPPDILQNLLPPSALIGVLDTTSKPTLAPRQDEVRASKPSNGKPPLSAMLNAFDFEAVARQILKPEAWAYYSSGSDDEISLRENRAVFHRIWLRPRILINVKNVSVSTTMLGTKVSLPIYITSCALGKLGHPEGEVVLTRAAGTRGIIQMMPTLASCSLDEMIDAAVPNQTLWLQVYVNADRSITERAIRRAESRGVKGFFITVDAPQLGRREKDMRIKFSDDEPDEQRRDASSTVDRSQGAARAISSFIDPALSWADIAALRAMTSRPIVLKGVQRGDDAVAAARAGCAGIVVSNHGGRQMDTVRSGVEILEEVITSLRAANLRDGFTVLVDGGFRRGVDVFKALAMGADGIGVGRPFLYAMSSYGQQGVEKLLDIWKDELEMCMRLMGCTRIEDIRPDMVDLRSLGMHVGVPPRDHLMERVYEPLAPVVVGNLSKL